MQQPWVRPAGIVGSRFPGNCPCAGRTAKRLLEVLVFVLGHKRDTLCIIMNYTHTHNLGCGPNVLPFYQFIASSWPEYSVGQLLKIVVSC